MQESNVSLMYMATENNFSDTLVEEYDLFGKVFPFHDDLQNTIPSSLKEHFPQSDGQGLTFLDIGAGYGFTTKLVAEVLPKAKFIVNEYDAELISRADAYLQAYDYEKRVGDIEEIIKAADPSGSIQNIVKTTIFLTNLEDFAAVNQCYTEVFQNPLPARSTVQVAALPKGAQIEIESIAEIN